MKKVSLLVVGVLLGLALSYNASAQLLPGISEMTGFIGTTFNGTEETTAGAAITVNVTPRLGVEGEVGVIFAGDEIINCNIDLVFNLGTGTSIIVPYFIGGAGILNNGGTDIVLNVGAGLKLFVEPNMALRFDFRGFFNSEGGDIEDLERVYAGFDFFF